MFWLKWMQLCCLLFTKSVLGINFSEGWNHIDLHCRDNDNKPVDWWIIYKPPAAVIPFFELGLGFSYLEPGAKGRWLAGPRNLNDRSMFLHTLAPIFRKTYMGHVAYFTFKGTVGATASGIVMADELGGVVLFHNVKDLPDFTKDRPMFPMPEAPKGHLMICLSLDLVTLNELAESIKSLRPVFTHVKVPDALSRFVPDWVYLNKEQKDWESLSGLEFVTKKQDLRAVLLVRKPGENHCLFSTFAKEQSIILDIYGDTVLPPYCNREYGVRSIERISIKEPNMVYYIKPKADKTKFAVSTAAHWQEQGAKRYQYWGCMSSLDLGDESKKGGILLCIDDYRIWSALDNLKVKEPTCE